jgi:hypothetical protein
MPPRALGPEPVRRRERRREAERVAYPRLAALGTIALLLAIITPRIEPGKRKLLWLTAAAPAALFAIDGTLAVRRTLSEAYAVAPTASREPWRDAEQRALQAEREEHWAQARDLWARAIAAGGAAGPIHYQLGLRARERGDLVKARADFARALNAHPPRPERPKNWQRSTRRSKSSSSPNRSSRAHRPGRSRSGRAPSSGGLENESRKKRRGVAAVQQARDLVGDGAWRGAELKPRFARARATPPERSPRCAASRPTAA